MDQDDTDDLDGNEPSLCKNTTVFDREPGDRDRAKTYSGISVVAEPEGREGEGRSPRGPGETADPSTRSPPGPVESMREGSSETPTLVCLTGARAGEATPLDRSRLTLGRNRDEVDIWFADRAVSRVHAVVERFDDDTYEIRDLESANGTYVNRKRVESSRELESGDKIVLSQEAILKFATPDSVERQFHERMYQSSVRDRLTGANTRAYLEEQMASEIGLTERYAGDVEAALLFLDLDHFKAINDTHGHPLGDAVLAAFANRCQSLIRQEDVFARYGGEEFAILLRMTDFEWLRKIAERLRAAVAADPFGVDGRAIDLTISAGGAYYDRRRMDGLDDWMARADEALYEAKESGRNSVRIAPRRGDPPDGRSEHADSHR